MKHAILMLALAATLQAPRARSDEPAAPGAEAKAEAGADDRVVVVLKLKHVAPGTMARWLAPIKTFNRDTERVEAVGAPLADTMLPNDAGRELWARTSPANEAALRRTVAALDVPLQQVQIKVQAARVSTSDLASLATLVPLGDADKSRLMVLSLAAPRRPSYKSTLQNLIESNRASLLLHQTFEATDRKLYTLSTEEPPESAGGLQGELTPAINDDGAISFKLQLRGGAQKAERKQYSIFNARDGDSVALVLHDADPASTRATILFITAILPRPGTAG